MRIQILLALAMLAGCAAPGSKSNAAESDSKSTAAATHGVPKPKTVTREQWGSTPDAIPDSRKHTPVWVTIHHAGELWTNRVDAAVFVKNMQDWGKKRPQIE